MKNYLIGAGIIFVIAVGILWLHKAEVRETQEQEQYIYDNWGLSPVNVSNDQNLYVKVRDKGSYVDYYYLGHDRIDIMYLNGDPYGLYEDGSGVLLPKD